VSRPPERKSSSRLQSNEAQELNINVDDGKILSKNETRPSNLTSRQSSTSTPEIPTLEIPTSQMPTSEMPTLELPTSELPIIVTKEPVSNNSPDESLSNINTTTTKSSESLTSSHKRKSSVFYESAVQDIEQEKKVVTALKRLSMGHMMNYDPDSGMDDIEMQLKQQYDEPAPVAFSSSKEEQPLGSPEEEFFDAEDTDRIFDTSNPLLWVPADLHPEVDPEQFKLHIKTKVDEINQKLTNSQLSTPSRKSSLRKSYVETDDVDLEDEELKRSSSRTSNCELTTSRSSSINKSERERKRFSNPPLRVLTTELERLSKLAGMDATDAVTLARTLSTSSLGYTDIERLAIGEISTSNKRNSLNSMDGIDLNDEEDETSFTSSHFRRSTPSPISTSLQLQQQLQKQFQLDQLLREKENAERDLLEQGEYEQEVHNSQMVKSSKATPPPESNDHQGPNQSSHDKSDMLNQNSPQIRNHNEFALRRSRRPDYRKPIQSSGSPKVLQTKQNKLSNLRTSITSSFGDSGGIDPNSLSDNLKPNRQRNVRDSQLLFRYKNPNEQARMDNRHVKPQTQQLNNSRNVKPEILTSDRKLAQTINQEYADSSLVVKPKGKTRHHKRSYPRTTDSFAGIDPSNEKSELVNQNLVMLRSEINEFKESLTKADKEGYSKNLTKPVGNDRHGDHSPNLSEGNESEFSFELSYQDVSYDDPLGMDQEILSGLDDEKPEKPVLADTKEEPIPNELSEPNQVKESTIQNDVLEPIIQENELPHTAMEVPLEQTKATIKDSALPPLPNEAVDDDDADDDDVDPIDGSSPVRSKSKEKLANDSVSKVDSNEDEILANDPFYTPTPLSNKAAEMPKFDIDESSLTENDQHQQDGPETSTPKRALKKKSFAILGAHPTSNEPVSESVQRKLKKKKSWGWLKDRSSSLSSIDSNNLPPIPDKVAIASRSLSNPENLKSMKTEVEYVENRKIRSNSESSSSINTGKENMITKLFKKKKSTQEGNSSIHSVESGETVSDYESEGELKKKKGTAGNLFKKRSRAKLVENNKQNDIVDHNTGLPDNKVLTSKHNQTENKHVEVQQQSQQLQKEIEKGTVPLSNKIVPNNDKENVLSNEQRNETELKSSGMTVNDIKNKLKMDKLKKRVDEEATKDEKKEDEWKQEEITEEEKPLQSTLEVQERLRKSIKRTSKANQPIEFTDSAFGFPLPPPSQSTLVMLDYRFPVHVERAIYRLSHLKLANPKRSLREQVLLSNFMYAYLNLVDHTLHLEQQMNDLQDDEEHVFDQAMDESNGGDKINETIPLDLDMEIGA
jgi:hypothetical protein